MVNSIPIIQSRAAMEREIHELKEEVNLLKRLVSMVDPILYYSHYPHEESPVEKHVPDDILVHILSHLEVNQLGIVGRTCKRWKKVASSDVLWKYWVIKEFGDIVGEVGLKKDQTYAHFYREQG